MGGRRYLPQAKGFPTHAKIFAGAFVLVVAANLGLGAGLPLFWPLAAWSVVLALHFFIASALDIDEGWAADRADDLRHKSYDFDHIRDIQSRIRAGDDTVVHHAERDWEQD